MNLGLDCPRPDELEAFARGNISGRSTERIQGHLKECPTCRTSMQMFASPTSGVPRAAAKDSDTFAVRKSAPESAGYSFLYPPVQPDEIGRLGNYRVLETLGQGGMGIVFLAEDIGLSRRVALKVMKPEVKADPEGWQRFLREARTLASIKHEHLVTIYQAGQEGDAVYFAMELLDGESLESWMQRTPAPEPAEIVRIGQEIASGLAALHQRRLVHRDIKPANIWLEGPERKVKILDLGLVRPVVADARLTVSGIILGTPDYMSPEQARGDPVDARTDLFSLGCVLYALCTGRKPFPGASFSAVLMALASETPAAPSTDNPRIPEALSELVMKLLSRKPTQRPESGAEVLAQLKRIAHEMQVPLGRTQAVKAANGPKKVANKSRSRDTEALEPSRRQRTADTDRARNWRLGLILGLALLGGAILLGVGATVAFWYFRPPPPGPPRPAHELFLVKTYLTEMKDTAREHWPFKMGPGGPKNDGKKDFRKKGPKGEPDFDMNVHFQGENTPHSIFMHPPIPPFDGEEASLTYDLGKQFKAFHATVSLNDGQESEAPCTFWVYGDGKVLWKSEPVAAREDTQKCMVSVKDVNLLKIAVKCDGPPRGAHAIWVEPFVAK